jgi:hypothetical protein
MADERYVRWQGLGIAQLSVAVALISGFSAAGLSGGVSLLQNKEFLLESPYNLAFASSLFLFVAAAFSSFGAVISRLLDFRLTARKSRKRIVPGYNKPLKLFGCGADEYGAATWRLFWASCIFLSLGAATFVASVGSVYTARLL